MRILYVEDDASDADLLRREMARGAPHVSLEIASTLKEARARLAAYENFDLALIDLRLPDGNGLALLAHIREQNLPLAVVILTGIDDEESAVTALKAGAEDYLPKRQGYRERLLPVLESALARFQAETARRAKPLRVLYAEHHSADIDLTRRHLAKRAPHVHLEVVHSGAEVLQRLPQSPAAECPYDVVLLDYRLPGENTLDILKEIRRERRLDLPVVFITGQGDVDVAVQALHLGATDYLTKHANYLYQLPTALENAFQRVQLLREQAALRASEVRFRATFAQAAVGMAQVAPDGRWLLVNRRVRQITGYPEAELLQLRLQDITHPDDREAEQQLTARLIAGEIPTFSREKRYICKDESVIWVDQSLSLVRQPSGDPDYFIAVVQDISARKRAEEEIRRSNRKLAMFNQIIAASASEADSTTILEIACRELALAFNLPQASAILLNSTKTQGEIVADYRPEDRPPVLDETIPVDSPFLQYLLTHRTPLVVENAQTDPRLAPIREILQRRGTVAALLVPLLIKGELVGSLNLVATEPRHFHVEEINLAWSVAEQVSGTLAAARLAEERQRLEEQYHQAQKMEAIGQLTAGIAHDFNNLLTAINGFAELTQIRLAPDDPSYEMVNKILGAGQQAARLVGQLLAFSRKQIIEPRIVELNEVVTNAGKILHRIIGEDIQLETSLDPALGLIKIDPSQIEQVIINLAVNARDAMPKGGQLLIETANVTLDTTFAATHLGAEPGEYVLLAVSDTGQGMDEKVKSHLFEPFFTTKPQGRGTGLGLATVYGIVKQNRGNIWVYSEVGHGTTFKIYLPRTQESGQPAASPAPVYKAPTGHETILLVEDEVGVRELAEHILKEMGYTVLVAPNGQAALDVAAAYAGPIHLLLTDVVMPGMSGKALADQLLETRPDMRVLFVSGYTDQAIARHGILDPGVFLLQKPFSPAGLAQQVRKALL